MHINRIIMDYCESCEWEEIPVDLCHYTNRWLLGAKRAENLGAPS